MSETAETAERPVAFDPLEDGFIDSPYEQYARLRRTDPVHWSELLHGWVLTRYEDAATILRDPTISSDIDQAAPSPMVDAEKARREESVAGGRTLVLLDDPDHARLRKLIMKPFRPREVNELRDSIAGRVARALDRLLAEHGSRAQFDLIADFAYPFPVEVFCEMLGIPDEDHPQFRYWTQCVARGLDPVMTEAEREECMAGIIDMYAYLEEQVAEKRSHPTDDIMSGLVHAEEDGDTLTHDELLAQLLTLYVAGHEPTAGLVGNGLLALLRQPDQFERLRREPELRRNALSELLRFDGPNQFVRRITTRPMSIDGREIAAGDIVYVGVGAANRDPERWGDTVDQVVVDRADANQHLQFGAGIHACLGSHLARLQAELAFDAVLERLDDLQLNGDPEWSTRMVIRGLNHLPVSATITV